VDDGHELLQLLVVGQVVLQGPKEKEGFQVLFAST
jgi:hypothetical protein